MARASVQDQWRLLDLQDHDVRLAQLAHRERTLPEHAQLEQLGSRLATARDGVVDARTRTDDLSRAVSKAENDVDQVRQRAARDQQRLDSGQGSAKDLQALQHELASLLERQRVLEDAELEVMEQLELAQGELDTAQEAAGRLEAEQAELIARRDAELATIAQERDKESAARNTVAGGVPAELLAMYERIRSNGSVGAARLRQRRCEGCRLELNANDLGRIRDAAEDEVVRCEECGCILVRTAESGL